MKNLSNLRTLWIFIAFGVLELLIEIVMNFTISLTKMSDLCQGVLFPQKKIGMLQCARCYTRLPENEPVGAALSCSSWVVGFWLAESQHRPANSYPGSVFKHHCPIPGAGAACG
jgi:hypothetical protein